MYDSKTGQFLKEFNSRNEAENYLGVHSNSLGKTKTNEYETRHGYIWKDEYYEKVATHDYNYEILIIDKYSRIIIGNYYKLDSDFEYKNEKYLKYEIYSRCKNGIYEYKNILCCYANDYLNMITKIPYMFTGVYKIKNGIIVDAFSSYKNAANSVKGSAACIYECCKHKQHTAYGYKWESVGLIKEEDIKEKNKYIEDNYKYDKLIDTLNFDIFKKDKINFE